jgi:nucleoside-diphosphate-sugar epimerase
LGANGQTGRRVVQALAGNKIRPCVATTRTGTLDYEVPAGGAVETAAVDVSDLDSVRRAASAVPNLGAVVFCASASSRRQDSFAVDRDGVINAARCCIERRIPRFVVVSSGAVSRPDSSVYLLLNTVANGIMEAKIQGEDAIRDMYRDPRLVESGIGYTVIRPGGLTNDEPVGPGGLELNQGDTKSGRLSRQDVASLCVACLDSASAFDATFECYDKDTAKPLESVGLSNILKLRNPTGFTSGRECRGSSYEELLRGLERDA